MTAYILKGLIIKKKNDKNRLQSCPPLDLRLYWQMNCNYSLKLFRPIKISVD